jgi:hypothetical protein
MILPANLFPSQHARVFNLLFCRQVFKEFLMLRWLSEAPQRSWLVIRR